jgi:hypothetical protein
LAQRVVLVLGLEHHGHRPEQLLAVYGQVVRSGPRGQRPQERVGVGGVAGLDRTHRGGELLDEVDVDVRNNREPLGSIAGLAAVDQAARRRARCTDSPKSAVSSNRNGSEPPSSKTTFFKCRPATSATAGPARSGPVGETPCTRAPWTFVTLLSLLIVGES